MQAKKPLVAVLAVLIVALLVVPTTLFLESRLSDSHDAKTAASPPSTPAAATDASSSPAAASAAVPPSSPNTSGPATAPVLSSAQASAAATNSSASPAIPNVRGTVLPAPAAQAGAPAHPAAGAVVTPGAGGSWPTGFAGMRDPADILADKDLSDPAQRAQAVAEMSEAEEVRMQAVLEKAEKMGIPVRVEGPGHNVSILYDIREEGPLYRKTLNTNAAISTGANLLNKVPYNLNGEGMTVGVWDAARARTNHVELTGKVTIKDGTVANDDHSTHVAGTIAAKGVDPKAKGMGTNTLIHSYDWNNDYAEMTAAGAATSGDANKLPISNHSYGYGATNVDMGRYETEAQTTDALAFKLPYYQIFWAAGNEQDELTILGGYQSITFNGLAKNVVTVGAANDAVTAGVRDPSKATLAYFSSMGPCDDGRIKPDVVANGVNVYSCVASSTSAYDGTYSGTSMATPNAAGSAALLQQLYKSNFSGQIMRASMLKGLLIHTADDLGRPGPDYQYGWGLINVKAAADVILAHKASLGAPKLIEGTITSTNKVQTYTFTWDGSTPIRATLVWTDPAGVAQTGSNSRTRNLIHDLDLKVTAPNGTNTYLPYVMPFVGVWTTASMTNVAITGTNKVDNVERVDIPSPPQAGAYTVTVGMYGTNVLTTNQIYSIIVTGGADVPVNPPPVVTLNAPADGAAVLPGAQVNLTATAADTVIGGGPGVVAKVEFLNGDTVLGEDTTAPYTLAWTPPASGTYNLAARATDSEGATSTSALARLTVLTGDGMPTVTSFTPASGPVGTSVVVTGSNFAGVTAVKFNGVDAMGYIVDSATQITVPVPSTATTGPISVQTPFGTAVSGSNFTLLESPVTISQIYGAGGNTGAVYNADYVELYNRSDSTVSVAGWSVQYASASGTTWAVGTLTGSIAPGKYYLIKLAGGASGSALPTPDVVPTTSINMSGTSGKVALMDSTATLSGSSPIGTEGLQDFVGYGSANASETSPAPAASTTTAIFRAGGGATDTGNNSVDFSASTPNPRNASFGGASAPVITSPLTASGTVGTLFSYQIAASNTPTSYGAVGLPAGLSINTSSGIISGTPTIAGTSNISITASNGSGSDSKTLVLTIHPSGGGGDPSYIVDFEDGTKAAYASGNVTLNGIGWNMTEALIGGDANDFKNGLKSARLRGYSTSVVTMLADKAGGIGTISFQHRRYGTDTQVEWIVDYSMDSGTSWAEAGRFTSGASVESFSATVNSPNASRIRIRTEATGASNRRVNVDDIAVTSFSASTPSISTSGALSAVNTTYGAASPSPSSFTLSGANMVAGILVTPPPGFEVSKTSGGASGYAATQTVGVAGSIAETEVYVRLAVGTTAGQYSGDVVCSSTGAASVNVPIPSSNVRQKGLTITANDQAKPYGQALTLGAGQTAFTSSGLVLGQTIGSVTLTASGGTATGDASGVYDIVPSEATGGTFSAGNYEIGYEFGTLTVLGESYGSWSGGLQDPSPDADPDGDGIPNIAEYFMGLDAEAPDSGVAFSYENGVMTLDYRRNKNMQGVTGVVKWHPNLTDAVDWSTNEVTDEFLSDHDTYQLRRATLPTPPENDRRFMRLEITIP